MRADPLKIERISKSFGVFRAVSDLSVTVPVGCVYGFLGPNGAGKTTTIRMMMNIIRPDSGNISIFGGGISVENQNRISYMPEERGLYRKMTAAKVLAYFGSLKGLTAQELSVRVPLWLEKVQLPDCANKKVEELSKGMQQKLQFAVAAINEPELLILDEPFSGLDPVNQEVLKNILLQLKKEGKTIILSTHILSEAEKLCDSIVLINKGRTVIDGPLDGIKQRFSTGAVLVEIDGDDSFVRDLPMVAATEKNQKRIQIVLKGGADSQQLLVELVSRARVRLFEVQIPTLHEIFIKLVSEGNGQNS
jgi:ABC-2 type transport system ATP-binding protein